MARTALETVDGHRGARARLGPGHRWSSCTAIRRTSRSGARCAAARRALSRSSPSTGPAWASASPGPVARRPHMPIDAPAARRLADRARHHVGMDRGVSRRCRSPPPRCPIRGWCDELALALGRGDLVGDPHPPSLPREPGVLRRLPWVVFRRAEATFLRAARASRPPCAPTSGRASGASRARSHRAHVRRLPGLAAAAPALYPRIAADAGALGRADKHFPLAHAERLHARSEGSQLEFLPGAEHWMVWHAADESRCASGASERGDPRALSGDDAADHLARLHRAEASFTPSSLMVFDHHAEVSSGGSRSARRSAGSRAAPAPSRTCSPSRSLLVEDAGTRVA